MSNHLGASKTVELLDSLKRTVREFAAREERLNGDFRTKGMAERRRCDQAIAALMSQLQTATADAEAAFQTAKERADARHEQRKTHIPHAHRASLEQARKNIEDETGRRKYEVQRDMMQTKRRHETDLATAETLFAEFRGGLAEAHGGLTSLELTAQDAFKGYRKFRRLLTNAPAAAAPELPADHNQLFAEFRELLDTTRAELERFRSLLLPRFFKHLPIWLTFVFCQVPLVFLLQHLGINRFTYRDAFLSVVVFLVGGFALHCLGRRQGDLPAAAIAGSLGKARRLHDACQETSAVWHQEELQRIKHEFESRTNDLNQQWDLALEDAVRMTESSQREIDERATRAADRNEQLHRARLEHWEQVRSDAVGHLSKETDARTQQAQAACEQAEAKLNASFQAQWQTLETEWKGSIQPLYEAINAAITTAEKLFPAWQPERWEHWTPPPQFAAAARFARLEVDVEKLAEGAPRDQRLALPGPPRFTLPLQLTYPQQGSVLFETTNTGRDQAIAALNNLVLRLLSVAPPGRLSFTILDPVGLGQSFSGVMHLADYAEHLINSRIWTQSSQFEERLAALNEHMEKVIQMYLRNEYATIAEYNEQAGNIAEKYHFLVVADFPANFSDTAARRLLSIAASGARCGVFTLIHWDRRQPLPQDSVPDELRKSSVSITCKGGDFMLTGKLMPGANLLLDAPPDPEFAIGFIQKVGLSSRDSNRVEVPFSHVTPPEGEVWTGDTTTEVRVAIGRTGATKLQYLAIGKDTRQHALIAGKTGSGKSTLFHVMITNLALWCSPEQVEFYLVDFKKGVEFKCYAAKRLPHARVVAIESDREFGLSVLQRVDEELKRRGDMFRQLGVQDIAGYKRAGGREPVPRSLLIIDEFQEFFVEDDRIAQTASVLLDRIVRQGRAFGIHVLLGSQTLGGAYTLARTTLGQMVIRIALQCNEADAYLIMDDNNPAPRLLSRPGEGIYNDNAGALEGNSPFQTVWLPDEVRDASLDRVREQAARAPVAYPGPIVFEGNAPADVRENSVLRQLLEAPSINQPAAARIWLGAPNSIKGPTEAVFQRQGGNNLLLVGQRDDAVLAILSVALVSLAAQYHRGAARFIVLDATAPDSPHREYLERIVRALPHAPILAKAGDLPELMTGLANDLKQRAEDERTAEAPATFLFIHGLQKYKKLRPEDDFSFASEDSGAAANPGAQLSQILTEGASLGFHVIATCDTFNNVNRFLGRKALSEFEMRVLFQMSANDSASLIDSPKASLLGLHRALFYNEQEGHLEMFRPYALPTSDWIDQAARNLARLLK